MCINFLRANFVQTMTTTQDSCSVLPDVVDANQTAVSVTTEQNTDEVFEENNNMEDLKTDRVKYHNEQLNSDDDVQITNVGLHAVY